MAIVIHFHRHRHLHEYKYSISKHGADSEEIPRWNATKPKKKRKNADAKTEKRWRQRNSIMSKSKPFRQQKPFLGFCKKVYQVSLNLFKSTIPGTILFLSFHSLRWHSVQLCKIGNSNKGWQLGLVETEFEISGWAKEPKITSELFRGTDGNSSVSWRRIFSHLLLYLNCFPLCVIF